MLRLALNRRQTRQLSLRLGDRQHGRANASHPLHTSLQICKRFKLSTRFNFVLYNQHVLQRLLCQVQISMETS
jgi:hypothetical protein